MLNELFVCEAVTSSSIAKVKREVGELFQLKINYLTTLLVLGIKG